MTATTMPPTPRPPPTIPMPRRSSTLPLARCCPSSIGARAANVVPKAAAARRDRRTLLAARRGVGLQRFDEERAALDWLVGRGRRARPVHLAAPLTSTPAGLQ